MKTKKLNKRGKALVNILVWSLLIWAGCKLSNTNLLVELNKLDSFAGRLLDASSFSNEASTNEAQEMVDNIDDVTVTEDGSDKTSNVLKTSIKEFEPMSIFLTDSLEWKSIIDANGGLTTQKNSIFDKLGLTINIKIVDDVNSSLAGFDSEEADIIGCNLGTYSYRYYKKDDFKNNPKMVSLVSSSSNEQVMVSNKAIKNEYEIIDKTIGIPRFTESVNLISYFINKNYLSQSQVECLWKNIIYFDTVDEVFEYYLDGKIDLMVIPKAYLSEIKENSNNKIIFSSGSDMQHTYNGIAFSRETIKNGSMERCIEGIFMAAEIYEENYDIVKNALPSLASKSEKEIKEQLESINIYDMEEGEHVYDEYKYKITEDMLEIWNRFSGKEIDKNVVKFDGVSFDIMNSRFETFKKANEDSDLFGKLKEENTENEADETLTLKSENIYIDFKPNSQTFTADSQLAIEEFVDSAKKLNDSIIEIRCYELNKSDLAYYDKLLNLRIQKITSFFEKNQIDSNRLVIINDGGNNENSKISIELKTIE